MIYQTLCILFFLIFLATPSCADINPNWKTFEDPDQTDFLTLIVKVHNVTGDVYLASPNHLYHLDADLVLKKRVVIGPGKVCDAPQINCTDVDKKYVPHSMVIAYHLRSLVICGSLYNGMCEIRPLDDLERSSWIGPYNDRVALCTHRTGDPGYFGHGSSFFSGADHDTDEISREERKAFFSRKELVEENGNFTFKYFQQTDTSRSAIFFNSKDTQITFYSFIYKSHAYIVFLRTNPVITKTILARVCLEDGSFHTYMEQPLVCKKSDPRGPKLYDLASAAYLGPGNKPSSKSLYLAFFRVNEGAAICEYDMDFLEINFHRGLTDCFNKGDRTNLINPEDGMHRSCNRETGMMPDSCGPSINPYIYQKIEISSEPDVVMNIPTFHVTALAVILENRIKVAFIGGKPAVFAKMILSRNRGAHADHAGGNVIQRSIALDLKEEHVYFLASAKIIKYPMRTCSVYETCKDCFQADIDPLHCGWCDGRCAQKQECTKQDSFSRDKCSPSIHQISPLRGSSRGGTLLSISGKNFGPENRTRYRSSIQVAGIECRITYWFDSSIGCVTMPSNTDTSGFVVVNTRDSQSTPFTYQGSAKSNETFTTVTPKLFGISPDRGSISGGTNITLFGRNFDVGTVDRINIQGRDCRKLLNSQYNVICVTATSANASLKKAIEMTIDNYVIGLTDGGFFPLYETTSQHFSYLPDPEIEKIHPTDIISSYKGKLTVIGRYLDSVKDPKMLVNVFSIDGKPKQYNEECLLIPSTSGTVMTCSFPSLDVEDITMSENKHPSHFAKVKFQMYPFRSDFPEIESTKLWIYPDPWYEPFVNVQNITNNQSSFKIKGKYPPFVSLNEMINVQIGEDTCNVSGVTLDTLTCELPSKLVTNASVWGENLPVQVQSGSDHHLLGYLVIKNSFSPPEESESETLNMNEQKTETKTWLIVLAVVLVLLICIAAGFGYWFVRKRNKDRLSGFSSMIPSSVAFRNDYRPAPTRPDAHPINAVSLFGEATAVPLLDETTAPQTSVRTFSREPSTTLQDKTPFLAPSISTTAAPLGYLSMNKKQSNDSVPKMVQPLEPSVVNTRPELQRAFSIQNEFINKTTIRELLMDGTILQRERLTLGDIIGSGFFGYVIEGKYNCPMKGDIHVAVKRMNESVELTQKSVKEFFDEGVRMKDFRNDHVLGLIGICFENRLPMILIPYMENGDLCGYLRNPDIKSIMVSELRKFATDAAEGMAYLAKNKYVHRDLAARNCVLDGALNVKISDFGLSRDIYDSEYYAASEKRALPYKWMAPEAIELSIFTVQSDVWSYGVLLWEIMTRGVIPFEEVHNWNLVELIKAGLRLPKPKRCSESMYRVMEDCWQLDPENRPSFDILYKRIKRLWQSVSIDRETVTAKCTEYENCE